MIAQTDKKNFAQPLQIRVDAHGVIVLNLRRQRIHPANEPPLGSGRAEMMKAKFDRLIDYLFDVA